VNKIRNTVRTWALIVSATILGLAAMIAIAPAPAQATPTYVYIHCYNVVVGSKFGSHVKHVCHRKVLPVGQVWF